MIDILQKKSSNPNILQNDPRIFMDPFNFRLSQEIHTIKLSFHFFIEDRRYFEKSSEFFSTPGRPRKFNLVLDVDQGGESGDRVGRPWEEFGDQGVEGGQAG